MNTATRPNAGTENGADPSKIGEFSLQEISSNQDMNNPAEAQASLGRLLASESINRAPRLHAVLKFMIDALMEGKAERVNEQIIGEEVFGRPRGYNPSEDNIVRVTIRHLRDRIEEFYRTEGRDEKYVFKIPKGRYVPIVSCQAAEQPALPAPVQEPLVVVASEESPCAAVAAGTAPSARRFVFAPSWILVALFAATVAFLGLRLHRLTDTSTGAASRQHGILSLMLANGKPTTVVVSDSNLEAYRMIFRRIVPLDAYLDYSYLHPPSDFPKNTLSHGAWTYIGATAQTSMSSMIIASEIQAASAPEDIGIKYPHDLNMRDIEHGNYIFLGGPWINPWEQLFESRLNFRVVPLQNEPWRSSIHNMTPLPSEPAVYALHNQGALEISYLRFALLRNQSNDGYIVLLGGTTEEAVEAGAGFLISQPRMDSLLKTFHVASPRQLPSLEVVIETSGLNGVPENFRIVAERIVNTPY